MNKPSFWKRHAFALVMPAIVIGLGGWLYVLVDKARQAAIASTAQCPLNQLQLALHCYHDCYGCFPPAYVADPQGRPMHSWRALVLPFVEQRELYGEYRFDEPWNGPHNAKLADRMPRTFHAPSEPESTTWTNIVAIVGPGTAFPGTKSTRMEEFTDGLDNTILLAEIAASDINWLEPRDLDVREMSLVVNHPTQPSISCSRRIGPYVVFGDSITAYRVNPSLEPETLRALTTIAGGEPLCMGTVTDIGLTSLGANPASDETIGQMRLEGVHRLWLSRSDVTDAAMERIAIAPQLSTLHLRGTRITDTGLAHLGRAANLHSLDLAYSRVSDRGLPCLATFAGGPYLSVDLQGTQVTLSGVAEFLATLPASEAHSGIEIELKEGTLSQRNVSLHGPAVTDVQIACLRGMTRLSSIRLADTRVTDVGLSGLASFPSLTDLALTGAGITDRVLEPLKKCDRLKTLYLYRTGVTDAGVQELQKTLPGCSVLR